VKFYHLFFIICLLIFSTQNSLFSQSRIIIRKKQSKSTQKDPNRKYLGKKLVFVLNNGTYLRGKLIGLDEQQFYLKNKHGEFSISHAKVKEILIITKEKSHKQKKLEKQNKILKRLVGKNINIYAFDGSIIDGVLVSFDRNYLLIKNKFGEFAFDRKKVKKIKKVIVEPTGDKEEKPEEVFTPHVPFFVGLGFSPLFYAQPFYRETLTKIPLVLLFSGEVAGPLPDTDALFFKLSFYSSFSELLKTNSQEKLKYAKGQLELSLINLKIFFKYIYLDAYGRITFDRILVNSFSSTKAKLIYINDGALSFEEERVIGHTGIRLHSTISSNFDIYLSMGGALWTRLFGCS